MNSWIGGGEFFEKRGRGLSELQEGKFVSPAKTNETLNTIRKGKEG